MKFQCKPQPYCLQKNSQCIFFICTKEGRKIKGEREGEIAVNVTALQIAGVRHSGPSEWKKGLLGRALHSNLLVSTCLGFHGLQSTLSLRCYCTGSSPRCSKALAHFLATCSFPLGLSLTTGEAPIRNSPKLTSPKSLLYQHDCPQNYTGLLRLLADVPPKPVSLVSLADSQSPCFIYPLPHVL